MGDEKFFELMNDHNLTHCILEKKNECLPETGRTYFGTIVRLKPEYEVTEAFKSISASSDSVVDGCLSAVTLTMWQPCDLIRPT